MVFRYKFISFSQDNKWDEHTESPESRLQQPYPKQVGLLPSASCRTNTSTTRRLADIEPPRCLLLRLDGATLNGNPGEGEG